MNKHISRMTSAARSYSGDEWFDEHYIANCVGSQRLIQYLDPSEATAWDLDEVQITAKTTGNRTGVPRTAVTWIYTLKSDGWTVLVRAVWQDGKLLTPLRTHTRVVKVMPDEDSARRAYNKWLCGLSLI